MQKTKRIHISQLWDLMEQNDASGRKKEFSIEFVKISNGELRRLPRCVLTSFHSAGDTLNLREIGELTPKKIKRILITKFNDINVYL